MSPLRVLHVVPHLDRVGGYERQALALAEHQAREQGLAPMLLTHAGHEAHSTGQLAGAPVEIHRLERGLRRYHPGPWWRNLRARGLPDVVHAHALHKLSGQIVARARAAGLPSLVKVATPADVGLFAEPGRWRELVEPEAEAADYGPRWRFMAATAWRRLRGATAFLALNEEIAAELGRHGLRVERIGNGVDCRRYAPPAAGERQAARAALELPPDARCVLSAGRLVARKDLECVLAALVRLPRATLLVCGDGPQAPALAARARALAVAHRVRWLGLEADVRPALHAADAFVHASRSEGFPNAMLEALACGLPAVLSDIPGHRGAPAGGAHDGADDGALFFPPGDDAALAAALGHLLDDPVARTAQGRAARTRALARHDLRIIAARLEFLYERCIAETAAGRPSPTQSG